MPTLRSPAEKQAENPTTIAFLFPQKTTAPIDWVSIICIYPTLQRKRLSWRETDVRFGAFIDFMESDGQYTRLSEIDWHETLARHLEYLPNRHFLFMLWQGFLVRSSSENCPRPEDCLPEAIAQLLRRSLKNMEMDRSLLNSLEKACISENANGFPLFREIPLATAFMYNTLQQLISQQNLCQAQESE